MRLDLSLFVLRYKFQLIMTHIIHPIIKIPIQVFKLLFIVFFIIRNYCGWPHRKIRLINNQCIYDFTLWDIKLIIKRGFAFNKPECYHQPALLKRWMNMERTQQCVQIFSSWNLNGCQLIVSTWWRWWKWSNRFSYRNPIMQKEKEISFGLNIF